MKLAAHIEYGQFQTGGMIIMAEPFLKYRTRFTSSLKNELVPLFGQLAKKTRIAKSRLLDEAIEDLLTKYTIELPTEDTKD